MMLKTMLSASLMMLVGVCHASGSVISVALGAILTTAPDLPKL